MVMFWWRIKEQGGWSLSRGKFVNDQCNSGRLVRAATKLRYSDLNTLTCLVSDGKKFLYKTSCYAFCNNKRVLILRCRVMKKDRRAINSRDIPNLLGTEGWREMYPYYYQFAQPASMPKKAKYESSTLWFHDSLHYPDSVYPLDLTWDDMWHHTASAWFGRIHVFPRNLGRDHRIVNGHVYINSIEVTDPDEIAKRSILFKDRVSYTLKNWKSLYSRWEEKVKKLIQEFEDLEIPSLPDIEPMSVITEGKWSTGHDLLVVWNRLMEMIHLIWEWHFEFSQIVTLVNVQYIDAAKRLFPGITDKSIIKTLVGFEAILFRVAKTLIALARSAIELEVDEEILSSNEWNDVSSQLANSEQGIKWISAWKEAQGLWFNISGNRGWHHTNGSWKVDPNIPLCSIQEYIEMIKQGKAIDKSWTDVLSERDRITAGYRELIQDEKDREVFDILLEQARTVSHYPEDYDFYIENRFHSIAYKKFREFGEIMATHGVIKEADNIFLMNRFEIPEVLYDIISSWYCGVPPYGQEYWPPKIALRKDIMRKFKDWVPPEAIRPDILKGKSILVVDDEKDILELLLEALGMCKIDTASSFEEAKELLETKNYDVAILDIMGVRGYELLAIANHRKIPALMLTAHALSEENLTHSAKEGAAYYAPKEEIDKIDLFVTDVLEAKEKKKNVWIEWLDRLGPFFDRRFGGRGWMDKEKEFWREQFRNL